MDKQKELVTGGSGYIALHLISQLLEAGRAINATVRSLANESKCKPLRNLQASYPGKLELFESDLLIPGSFRAAMAGCTTVYHVASPFLMPFQIKNGNEEIVQPILRGIQNIVDTVNQTASVKRLVLESSLSAVFGDLVECYQKPNHRATEADWNATSTERSDPYAFAKMTAERRAWAAYDAQSGQPPRWHLVAVCSSFVVGPPLAPGSASGSLWTMDRLLSGADRWGCLDLHLGFVDVRDVATALLRAGAVTAASGRYIVAPAESCSLLEVADMMRSVHQQPRLLPKRTLPKLLVKLVVPLMGVSSSFVVRQLGFPLKFDNARAIKELGLEYRPLEETLKEHYGAWAAARAGK